MNKNDQEIKSLLESVKNKKKALGKLKRKPLETNGIFEYNDNEWFNINTVYSKKTFIEALAFLISKEKAYKEACDKLGIKEEFDWGGYSIDEWEADFKATIDNIKWTEQKRILEATEEKLNSLVSSEGKTAMEIETIKDLLISL
ncbi:MAG: hypothetical protein ACOCV1_08155 [Bacillota bacterium]